MTAAHHRLKDTLSTACSTQNIFQAICFTPNADILQVLLLHPPVPPNVKRSPSLLSTKKNRLLNWILGGVNVQAPPTAEELNVIFYLQDKAVRKRLPCNIRKGLYLRLPLRSLSVVITGYCCAPNDCKPWLKGCSTESAIISPSLTAAAAEAGSPIEDMFPCYLNNDAALCASVGDANSTGKEAAASTNKGQVFLHGLRP